jgi:6-phosphogluconolactonase/glucosamine-6-phosphate isomerase/deaminase
MAAGDTPRLACKYLKEIATRESVDFSRCVFVALDEWVGIPPDNEGSCFYFLNTPRDLDLECQNMDAVIRQKGGIDLMVVGVGMNGHIGFNEPGVSPNLYSHVIALDQTTQTVGQKYFKTSTTLQKGITLGLRHLLESRKAILMASGQKKAEIIRNSLEEKISDEIPSGIIRKHDNGSVMIDKEAASLLTVTGNDSYEDQ